MALDNTQIDPSTGLTTEKSSKPQAPKVKPLDNFGPSKTSGVTRKATATGINLGTDLFGKSNFERISEEYNGVNVFTQDAHKLRAEEQPWTHQAIGAITQAGIGEIFGGTVEGIGYLFSLPSALYTASTEEGKFSELFVQAAMQNPIAKLGAAVKEGVREAAPIHQTGSGWNPGDAGWWFSNAVSVASTLSLMVPAMGASKALGALGKGLSKLGAGKAVSAIQGTKTGTQIFRKAASQAAFSRHMENMMEASGTYNDQYQKLLGAGKTEAQAKEGAATAAATNYKLGWAMYAQDLVQYGMLAKFKNPYTNASVNPIEQGVYNNIAKMGKVGQYLNNKRVIGSMATAFVSEGAEEAYQHLAAEQSKYLVDFQMGLAEEKSFGERLGDYSKDGDLWTAAIWGGIGGSVFQAVGSKADEKERKDYESKQIAWMKARGGKMAEMADNIAKADKAGDLNSMIEARKTANVTMTLEAIRLGQLGFHLEQLGQFENMSAEDLEAYNSNPINAENQLSPEFISDIVPELLKDARKISEIHNKYINNTRYHTDTVGGITRAEFMAQDFADRAKQSEKLAKEAKDLSTHKVSDPAALELRIQEEVLRQANGYLNLIMEQTNIPELKKWAGKRKVTNNSELKEVSAKLAEKSKEGSTVSVAQQKMDDIAISAVLEDADIMGNSIQAITSSLFSEYQSQSASFFKSNKFQQEKGYKEGLEAITNVESIETLDILEDSIKTANMPDESKSDLLDAAKIKREQLEGEAKAAESHKEAEDRAEEVVNAEPNTVETPENPFQPAAGFEEDTEGEPAVQYEGPKPEEAPFNPFQPDNENEAEENTVEIDKSEFTSKDPFQKGDKVVSKVGDTKTQEGEVIGKDSQGRFKVKLPKRIQHFGAKSIEKVVEPTPEQEQQPTQQTSDVESKKADIERQRHDDLTIGIPINKYLTPSNSPKDALVKFRKYLTDVLGWERMPIGYTKPNLTLDYLGSELKIPASIVQLGGSVSSLNLNQMGGGSLNLLEIAIEDVINAKYDAELAALEQPTQQSSEVEVTPEVQEPSTSSEIQTPVNQDKQDALLTLDNLLAPSYTYKSWEDLRDVVNYPENSKEDVIKALEKYVLGHSGNKYSTINKYGFDKLYEDIKNNDIEIIRQKPQLAEVKTEPLPPRATLEVKEDEGGGELVVNYKNLSELHGWVEWINSGAEVDGAEIAFFPATSFPNYLDSGKLKSSFEKLQRGEELTNEEKLYLANKYPLKLNVMVGDTVMTLGQNEVYNYLFDIKEGWDAAANKPLRAMRANIIKAIATQGSYRTKLKSSAGVSNLFDNTKDHGDVQENHLSILDKYAYTNRPTDYVVVNRENQYIDSTGELDTDTAKFKKVEKKEGKSDSAAGTIYRKLKAPSGHLTVAKLNQRRLDEAEADLVIELYKSLMADPTNTAARENPITDAVEKMLKTALPNYQTLISETPTVGEVMDFFIYVNQDDMTFEATKPGDIALIKGQVFFNLSNIKDEKGDNVRNGKGQPLTNNSRFSLTSDEAQTQAFKDYLTNVKRRNVNYEQFVNNFQYREYIIDEQVLNTDLTEDVFKKVSYKATVSVPKSTEVAVRQVAETKEKVTPMVEELEEGSKSTESFENQEESVSDTGKQTVRRESAFYKKMKQKKLDRQAKQNNKNKEC